MLRNGLQFGGPELIPGPHQLSIMLLQLRRAAQIPSGGSGLGIAFSGDQSLDKIGSDFDQNPAVGALEVLEGAVVELDGGAGAGEGGDGGGGEDVVRDGVEGDEEVGLAGEELVGDGEGRDGVPDVEGAAVADHVLRELEHYLAGQVLSAGEEPRSAAVEDQLHGGGGRAEASVAHSICYFLWNWGLIFVRW